MEAEHAGHSAVFISKTPHHRVPGAPGVNKDTSQATTRLLASLHEPNRTRPHAYNGCLIGCSGIVGLGFGKLDAPKSDFQAKLWAFWARPAQCKISDHQHHLIFSSSVWVLCNHPPTHTHTESN